jgi:hypothetical protein
MKRFIQLLIVLTILVIGIGFYRGWFAVSGDGGAGTGNVEVKLSVDTEKVRTDADAVRGGIKRKDAQREHGSGND